mmetsp:Transcript_22724/g.38962  ORF Transcript_22724/g.38962 Transcript_22724/m.38962 type:complete len:182 (-) Transcript_22724:502-1047(-)
MDVRDFPFDIQKLKIRISSNYGVEYLRVTESQQKGRLRRDVIEGSLTEWVLGDNFAVVTETDRSLSTSGNTYSEFVIEIEIFRRPAYTLINILIIWMLVLMNTVVFFLSPDQLADRSNICITASIFSLCCIPIRLIRPASPGCVRYTSRQGHHSQLPLHLPRTDGEHCLLQAALGFFRFGW